MELDVECQLVPSHDDRARSSRWREAAKTRHLAANLNEDQCVAVRISPSTTGAPIIEFHRRLTIGDHAFLFWTVTYAFFRGFHTCRYLRPHWTHPATRVLIASRAREIRRYSIASSASGYIASQYINPAGAKALHELHARLLALWAMGLTTVDTFIDSGEVQHVQVPPLLAGITNVLLRGVPKSDHIDGTSLTPAQSRTYVGILALGTAFNRVLRDLSEYHARNGRATSFGEVVTLFQVKLDGIMRAYVESLNQHGLENGLNWGRYYGLASGLTLDSALTPFLLLAPSSDHPRRHDLDVVWRGLNRLFFDAQILDDLIDIRDDLRSGIATTPTYLVLAQSKLSQIVLDQGADRWHQRRILMTALSESKLLLPFSRAWRDCRELLNLTEPDIGHVAFDDIGQGALDILLSAALANSSYDAECSLSDLARRRADIGHLAVEAWHCRDMTTVYSALTESLVVNRIFDTIKDVRNMAEIASTFTGVDPEMGWLIRMLHGWANRRYRRALQVWRPKKEHLRTTVPTAVSEPN